MEEFQPKLSEAEGKLFFLPYNLLLSRNSSFTGRHMSKTSITAQYKRYHWNIDRASNEGTRKGTIVIRVDS